MNKKLRISLIVFLIIIIITSVYYGWYNENIYDEIRKRMLNPENITITYDNQTTIVNGGYKNKLVETYCSLSIYYKKKPYFGKIDENAECIAMEVPDFGTMKIYYKDNDSVLFLLQREGHLTRKYILTDKTHSEQNSFNDFVDALYDDTNNEIFLN